MINKLKFKIKNKNEILALSFLIIVTVSFTAYYNHTQKKINNSYSEIINNMYLLVEVHMSVPNNWHLYYN